MVPPMKIESFGWESPTFEFLWGVNSPAEKTGNCVCLELHSLSFLVCVCVYAMHVCRHVSVIVYVWKSEDSFRGQSCTADVS